MNQSKSAFDGESLITPEMVAARTSFSKSASHDDQLEQGMAQLALVLSIAQRRFEAGEDPAGATGYLFSELHRMRTGLDPAVWRELVPIAQEHSVSEFVHQDPITRWSFEKPRGYSGDAQLLDLIYGHESGDEMIASATPMGKAINDFTKVQPAASAVRERRDLLARYVDEVAAARGEDTEILTVASGHLREAEFSQSLKGGKIKRWVALDQDPLSVGLVARDFHGQCVEAIDGSVKGLLGGIYNLGTFDFVYSAGLYDYLPRAVAVRLTRKCVQMLKPGGRFLFANFADDVPDDGYMETFMNWALLLRSEDDMWDIVNASVDRNSVKAEVFFGKNRNILYGVIEKLG